EATPAVSGPAEATEEPSAEPLEEEPPPLEEPPSAALAANGVGWKEGAGTVMTGAALAVAGSKRGSPNTFDTPTEGVPPEVPGNARAGRARTGVPKRFTPARRAGRSGVPLLTAGVTKARGRAIDPLAGMVARDVPGWETKAFTRPFYESTEGALRRSPPQESESDDDAPDHD